jgi:hypothetical protein
MQILSVGGLGLYSIVISVLLLRQDPKPLVVGVDQYGMRLLNEGDDPLLARERIVFLKEVLGLMYEYDPQTLSSRIARLGDYLSNEAWAKVQPNYVQIQSRMKQEGFHQRYKILDLREVDQTRFEADLEVEAVSKTRSKKLVVRTELELKKRSRSSENPYAWEVIRYEESI